MVDPISEKQKTQIYYSPSDNLYENTILVAKRAKQIVLERRTSFSTEVEEFEGAESFVDTIQDTNYRERVAKKYEKMPKPVVVAIEDVEEGNIMYSYPDKSF